MVGLAFLEVVIKVFDPASATCPDLSMDVKPPHHPQQDRIWRCLLFQLQRRHVTLGPPMRRALQVS